MVSVFEGVWRLASDTELEEHVFSAADIDDPPFRFVWPDGAGAYWDGAEWCVYDWPACGVVRFEEAILWRRVDVRVPVGDEDETP